MTTDTYPCPCELHEALAADPNLATPATAPLPDEPTAGPVALAGASTAPFIRTARLGSYDNWQGTACGHLFATPNDYAPLSCPVCDALCPVCEEATHPTQHCPAIPRERARQALGARVWGRFQDSADFIERLRGASEQERGAAADAMAAYLTATSGKSLTAERVLSAWQAMLATGTLEALEAELPFLLTTYDAAKLQDDEQAYIQAARALEAFYTRKAAYLKAQRAASEQDAQPA